MLANKDEIATYSSLYKCKIPFVISTKGLPLKNPISPLSSANSTGSFSVIGVCSLEENGNSPQSSLGLSNRLGNVSTLISRTFLWPLLFWLGSDSWESASAPWDSRTLEMYL